MAKIKVEANKCERCSHVWLPRNSTKGESVICPKCKSPYWNRPRISQKVSTKMKKGGTR